VTTRPPRKDCARSRSLLARMDEASAHHVDDPGTVLGADDLAWLAEHLESCDACAPDAAVVASLGPLLDDDAADLPGDAFFATRRAVLLDAIRASGDAPGATLRDGGVVGAGAPAARIATRPVLRAIPGTGARAGRGPRPVRRRSLWRPFLPVLAAGLAIVVALGALLSRSPRPETTAVAEVASGDLVAVVDADAADDSWLIEDDDLFEVALSSTSDPALDELSNDDLEEIEGVFVPSPGWS
jgi:hypothetical protein